MAIADRWRGLVSEGKGHLDISAARLGLGDGPQINDPDRRRSAPPAAA
jgi:hypothetical protein